MKYLLGHHTARPLAINASGVSVGVSIGSSGRLPVKWIDDTPQALAGLADGMAIGITAAGQIVGEHSTPNGTRAFLWDPATGPIDLPVPSGTGSSRASGINGNGSVIGDIDGSAVVWSSGPSGYTATLIEPQLPANSGWSSLVLYAINDNGQIAGTGGLNGYDRGFILSPAAAALIRVDLDRSTGIDFATDADRTTPDRRFVFLINNNRDIFDPKENEQDDVDPRTGARDFLHAKIACARDLEDFVRVHLRAPEGFDATSPDWRVKLSITDVIQGAPAVNVCAAVRAQI